MQLGEWLESLTKGTTGDRKNNTSSFPLRECIVNWGRRLENTKNCNTRNHAVISIIIATVFSRSNIGPCGFTDVWPQTQF